MRADVLVVGAGVAGAAAALAAKRREPGLRVVLVGDEPPYRRPDIFSVMEGLPPSEIDTLGAELRRAGVDVRVGRRAGFEEGGAIAVGGEEVEYGALVLATGASAWVPPVGGIDLAGVHTFRGIGDAFSLRGGIEPGVRAAVVGAGLIGVKMAAHLARAGLKVTLIEMLSVMWTVLDPPLSDRIRAALEADGVRVMEGAALESVRGDGRVREVVAGGTAIPADLVVVATGVRPTVPGDVPELARGIRGAVRVDRRARAGEGIYAAGDCAESFDLPSGERTYRPVGSVAYLSGTIAGLNAAGAGASYRGFVRRQAEVVLGIEVTSVGLSGAEARALGVPHEVVTLRSERRPGGVGWWYGDGADYLAVVERGSDRVLGLEAVGWAGSRRPVAAAIPMIGEGRSLGDLEVLGLVPSDRS